MALQFSVTLRNNMLDQIESTAGVSALLQLWSGALPANCAAADAGSKLAELTLPSDWMAAASSGTKLKAGTWSGTGAIAGTVVHFRIKDSTGVTCILQGTVTLTAGGGDMTVDNTSIGVSQPIVVNTFTITAPAA